MGGGVAEQRPHRLAVRAVGAEHQRIDAEHPDQRVQGARTVAGRVHEQQRVERQLLAAAQHVPLVVERREPGAGAEHHPEPRERGAAGERLPAHQAACSWPT